MYNDTPLTHTKLVNCHNCLHSLIRLLSVPFLSFLYVYLLDKTRVDNVYWSPKDTWSEQSMLIICNIYSDIKIQQCWIQQSVLHKTFCCKIQSQQTKQCQRKLMMICCDPVIYSYWQFGLLIMCSSDLWTLNISLFSSLSDVFESVLSGWSLKYFSIFFPFSRPKVEVIVPYFTVMPSFWDTTTQPW